MFVVEESRLCMSIRGCVIISITYFLILVPYVYFIFFLAVFLHVSVTWIANCTNIAVIDGEASNITTSVRFFQ